MAVPPGPECSEKQNRRARRVAWCRLALIVSAMLAGCLLAMAFHLRDPSFLSVRWLATPGVVVLGSAGALAGIWCWHRNCRYRRLIPYMILLWAAGPTVAIHGESRFARQVERVLDSGAEGANLGRHFLIGYNDVRSVAPLVARGLIGGVFVTTRNVSGRDMEALRAEIADLQSIRHAAGLPPLFVTTDQEGGMVSRMSPPLPLSPPPGAFAALPMGEGEAAAREAGASQGAGLARIGVNVNFAPVLDLRMPGPTVGRDPQSRIADRAISDDPQVVAAIGLAYVRGLMEAGVTATLKHFPGLGRATADTHHVAARIEASRGELDASDLIPFRRVLSSSEAWLMLGHATATALDSEWPVSLSARVVQGLLREEWGYGGVVVTDDLNMGPILSAGLCSSVVAALNAGVDVLLLSWDPDQYFPAMACALEARRRGTLDIARLAESRARLDRAAPATGHR